MANKWKISKDFFCDYGHRVWTQELKEVFCAIGDTSCKCKHLHGHTGKITVEVGAEHLERGFVTDFKHLGFIKDYVDEYFDHRFIIDVGDPLFLSLTHSFGSAFDLEEVAYGVKRFIRRLDEKPLLPGLTPEFLMELPAEQLEYIESFTVVNFVPTSENLARHMFKFAEFKLMNEAEVTSVTWQETPKSKAVYTNG